MVDILEHSRIFFKFQYVTVESRQSSPPQIHTDKESDYEYTNNGYE